MKTKTIFLLVFLIIILFVILFIKSKAQTQVQNNQAEQTNEIESSQQTEVFKLTSTSIESQEIGITEPVRLEFNHPVFNNFIYTLEPKKDVKVYSGTSPNELIIDPVDAWGFDTNYTLTVFKSTLSSTGQTLDKDYIYIFKTPPYSGI